MSIISFPRRETTRVPSRPKTTRRAVTTTPRSTHRVERRTLRARVAGISLPMRAAAVGTVALFVVLVGNTYSAQRQVQLHQMQTQLLQAQSAYAEQVATLTNVADPARVASRAGSLHLVVPTSVSQIAPVSLDAPLPLPKLAGNDVVTARTYQ